MAARRIDVVGAGLCGLLFATLRARAGAAVRVMDALPDPRALSSPPTRHLGMLMSGRAEHSLHAARIRFQGHPLRGRVVHAKDTQQRWSWGGGRVLHGVSRTSLVAALVQAAHEAGVTLHWGHSVTGEECVDQLLVGCDGRHSAVRRAHFDSLCTVRNVEHEWRSVALADGGTLDREWIHVFPLARGFLHLMATDAHSALVGTLVLKRGASPVEEMQVLRDELDVDAMLASASFAAPLSTVHCARYHRRDPAVVLLGDAAHATVPFAGQGVSIRVR